MHRRLHRTGNARARSTGFTLIELLVVVAILGIVAAAAYPSYQDHVRRSRRAEGAEALAKLASQLEKYAYDHSGYAGATIGTLIGAAISTNGHYSITMPTLTATTYEIRATPMPGTSQAADSECLALILFSNGVKNVTGSCASSNRDCAERCW